MSHGLTGLDSARPKEPSLKKVDRLEFTILVDNSIEWMTKMPPGFGSEIKGHLDRGPPVDSERTGIPVLDLDEYCCGV
jgi:7,8-dihydropterin-6-yl-methyl-4-(beta-D-ribofuranosyl)aminobenzene 5'-phosphate synthase